MATTKLSRLINHYNVTVLTEIHNRSNDRKCIVCGRRMTFIEFLNVNTPRVPNWSYGLMEKIWDNDLFDIKCCYCYRNRNPDALDALFMGIAVVDTILRNRDTPYDD